MFHHIFYLDYTEMHKQQQRDMQVKVHNTDREVETQSETDSKTEKLRRSE